MISEKACKGINKAKGFKGCGKLTKFRKYGLCYSCYPTWLYSTDVGKLEIEKATLKAKKQIEAKKRKEKSELKESLKSISKIISEIKPIFQKYIRLRDKDLPCISCGNKNPADWCGSHYFPAGVYSGLIFDERNCHGACNSYCNMYLSGNLVNYRIGLIERYGEEYVLKLEQDSLNLKQYKYTREELQQIKEKYKLKIKQYERNI